MNIVIMAGGGGTRLWPLSRDKFPKQFTQIFGKKTLLQHTFDRALKIVHKPENIVVATRVDFAPEVRKQLKKLPPENILIENVKRDSGPALGLVAAYLSSKGKRNEVMVSMPSDSYFINENLYIEAVKAANTFIEDKQESVALVGSYPTYPETGYGYIELSKKKETNKNIDIYSVLRFKEKPDLEKAKEFIKAGNFVWNMNVFAWRVGTLLDLLDKHAPEIGKKLYKIEECFKKGKSFKKIYEEMPKIAIDFAVMEHIDPKNIFVACGDYGWSDVGHWGSLEELLASKEGMELKKGIAAQVHSSGNFVYNTAEKAIGLVGISNLIIVCTPDALLVCDKKHVQDVKKLVEELGKQKKGIKFI